MTRGRVGGGGGGGACAPFAPPPPWVRHCTPIVFVEKMREAFAVQKLLSFLQQKISVYLVIKLLNT